MSEKVRLACVGLGRWARVQARGAQRGDVIDLVSCFSREEAKRTAFQQEFNIPRAASSYEELLADDAVEGIILTTPNDTHRPLIEQAFAAGKPIYTDKPIAATMTDAASMLKASFDTNATFAVGHSSRRLSGHRQQKKWIDDGTLGPVSLAQANFSNERGLELTPDTWRWYAHKSPGGAYIQLGVHHADTLQYLLGPVKSVTAQFRKLYTESEVPDAIMSILEFESGSLAYLGTGWASPGVYTLSLQGTKANLFYDLDFSHWDDAHLVDSHSSLLSQQYGEASRTSEILPTTDMFREQLEEFALATRGEAKVEVGGVEAVRALAVIEAALLSNKRNGASVEVAEILDSVGVVLPD
ncbi:MAG TPA: Gfo/Idh/MocA family oxidoreductase [Candidatus Nanopelagicaceae bacterium]|nr:Gfo/Idh/MocA family oxidoreductase [Candidatus Nanopelagicaceae bacterium]